MLIKKLSNIAIELTNEEKCDIIRTYLEEKRDIKRGTKNE